MAEKKYYIALTGAKKNVGDYLITNRAIELLKKITNDYQFKILPSWEYLEDIEYINKSEGIIILGGPGYKLNIYPGVYKLRINLQDIEVPIYILGGGWSGIPGNFISEKLYKFNRTSITLLNKIEKNNIGLSCRDYQTERILKNNGYNDIIMTGCPAWYDLDSIGKPFIKPNNINKIIFTPAQKFIYSNQCITLMKFIKEKFPNSKLIVSFHRGIGITDEFTSLKDAQNTKKIAEFAQKIGAEVIDTSYDSNKLKIYDDCDFHIGYRVHAHIYFLSKRLPSILINEDGRGTVFSETLKTPGIDGYSTHKICIFSK